MEKLQLFRVTDDYIDYLQQNDKLVCYNKNGARPYVGPVFENNGVKFYAPLTSAGSDQIKHNKGLVSKHFVISLEDMHTSEKLGAVRLNNMIPIPDSELTELDFTACSKQYQSLLKKEMFCIRMRQNEITNKACTLHKIKSSKNKLTGYNKEIAKKCCKFNLLAMHSIRYSQDIKLYKENQKNHQQFEEFDTVAWRQGYENKIQKILYDQYGFYLNPENNSLLTKFNHLDKKIERYLSTDKSRNLAHEAYKNFFNYKWSYTYTYDRENKLKNILGGDIKLNDEDKKILFNFDKGGNQILLHMLVHYDFRFFHNHELQNDKNQVSSPTEDGTNLLAPVKPVQKKYMNTNIINSNAEDKFLEIGDFAIKHKPEPQHQQPETEHTKLNVKPSSFRGPHM